MTDANDLLDISAAAQLLNVSETSLRRWTNAGVLPCLRIGRRRERRFRRGDLLAFMEQPIRAQTSADETQSEPVTVTHRSHLCGIYGSDTGRNSLCVQFLLEGLREGSVCLLVAPTSFQKEVTKTLQELHPSLLSDIKDGRLVMTEHQKSARAQVKYLETHLKKGQEAGASSFRIVGDMIGFRARASAEELIELEAEVDVRLSGNYPVSMLCVYDARKFSGVELLNVLKTHRDTFRYPLGRALA